MARVRAVYLEEEWLACAKPEAMVRRLEREHRPDRLWQLFACACCWRIFSLLDDRSREALGVAQRQAEGLAGSEEIEEARHVSHMAVLSMWQREGDPSLASAALAVHYALVRPPLAHDYAARAAGGGERAERRAQADLLRDIFGNPFRVVHWNPAWRNPTVLAIARDMDANDSFADMPILADALEDAGCEEGQILDHARLGPLHVRGCWLLNLLVEGA